MTEDKTPKQEELSDTELDQVSGGDGTFAPAGTLYNPINRPSDFATQSGLGASASSYQLKDPNVGH